MRRRAWWSIGAAIATIGLKAGAYALTSSVGLLSDALESVVNLVAAVTTLAAVTIAARPPDESHPFGHGKAEHLSAVAEGLLLLGAAAAIIVTAADRLVTPRPIHDVGAGLVVSALATVINGVVGLSLLRTGRRYRSPALVADGRHLFADVATSVGVIVGVLAISVTGRDRVDPLIAIAVGANVFALSGRVLRRAFDGLMDHALSREERTTIEAVLARYEADGVTCRDVQTRDAGHQRFVSLRVRVPGEWTVERGHALLDRIEGELTAALPDTTVSTHLEPAADPRA